MADGHGNDQNIDKVVPQPAAKTEGIIASTNMLNEVQTGPPKTNDVVAKAGDRAPEAPAATPASDAKLYAFDASKEGPQVQAAFGGTIADNQAASTARIADVMKQQTTPEGQAVVQAAATQWQKDMGADLKQHFK
jgi:hypothetical protein